MTSLQNWQKVHREATDKSEIMMRQDKQLASLPSILCNCLNTEHNKSDQVLALSRRILRTSSSFNQGADQSHKTTPNQSDSSEAEPAEQQLTFLSAKTR